MNSENLMISDKLLSCLRCIQCSGALSKSGPSLTCNACKNVYPSFQGIPDFSGVIHFRMPKIYGDPDYKQYLQKTSVLHDYFDHKGTLVKYIQHVGHRHVKSFISGRHYEVLLDLGCGDGAHIPYVSDLSSYVGVDIDSNSLIKLKNKYPKHNAIKGDCYNLPFRNASVDCLINIYNLEHLVFLDFICEEMNRVLTDDGDIYISVPNEGGIAWSMGRKISTIKNFSNIGFDYGRAVEVAHINCIWQINKTIKRYFKIIGTHCFPFGFRSFHLNFVTTYHLKIK